MNESEVLISPLDEYNRTLVANVHPGDWINPVPVGRYNLVVIGGGTAGLVSAAGAALLGGRVALIERGLLGGDCLNVGCVPSKTLIRSARAMAEVHRAGEYGIEVPEGSRANFAKVMERLRRIRAEISPHDSAREFAGRGVDVFLGQASFAGADTIRVGETTLRFVKAVIATGGRAKRPAVPGLEEAGYLTNETVFALTKQPRRLGIIGAGAIGCELAQTFARLGSEVTLLQKHARILDREDPDASQILREVFRREGIRVVTDCRVSGVERTEAGKLLHFETPEGVQSALVDEVLISAGRVPNVEELNLEGVGVRYDGHQGIEVDDRLRTTNPRIYACGDVCMSWKYTHAADAAARIVVENALAFGRKKLSDLVMPWCTYTDPEIAHVGLYESEAEQQGLPVQTCFVPLIESDRARVDGESEGFVKIHLLRGSDRILGATVVARHAGEMINELTLAMVGKLGLSTLARVIHPYPTQAEAIRKAADEYSLSQLQRLTKFTRAWLGWIR